MVFDILILVFCLSALLWLNRTSHPTRTRWRLRSQVQMPISVCVCELNANIQTNLAEKKKKGTEEVSFTHFIIFSYKKIDS